MEHEITLKTFAYGGDAMGRLPDGRAVFVPFGLAGERVSVRLTEEKKNFARGEIVEIIEPSKYRVEPKCKHFGECGGCHYQHLPYERQLEIKTEILRDQLTRIGKIENPPVQPMVGCPNPWNYRNHIQFSLDKNGKLGYVFPLLMGEGRRRIDGSSFAHRVEMVRAISECHLPEPVIHDFWHQLEFEPETNIERVSLRAGNKDDLMLILESDSPEPPELEIKAGISVVHIFEDNPVVIAGNDHIFTRVLGRDFKASAASFFQVNTTMAEKMVEHLITQVPITSSTTLLDLYCGVGLFSAFFASKCKTVIGVESSASACEDFTFNLDEFNNVELYEGAAEDVIPHLEVEPDIVVADPPRAGLDKRVVDGILKLNPKLIAYVSCDPSTLARDTARLIHGGYRLREVTPFDVFPQTYHIESISIFEK